MATTAAPSAPTTAARSFPLMYFVLALALTWVLWWPAALEARGLISLPIPAQPLGALGPLVAAVIVTAQESGRAGLRSLLGRILQWRVAPIWYGVALLGPPLLYLVAMALEVVALGGQPPSLGSLVGVLPILAFYAVYMVFFVALGEEVGWRGYALPALQSRYSALVSSVILGALWALWHLPLFFNPDLHYSNMPFVLQLAFQIPAAILFTWVFNSTGGSVLLAILMHAVLNASSRLWNAMPEYSVEPPTAAEAAAQTVHINVMFAIVVGVAAVVVVLVYGPRNLSRHPRQVLATASGESQPRVQ